MKIDKNWIKDIPNLIFIQFLHGKSEVTCHFITLTIFDVVCALVYGRTPSNTKHCNQISKGLSSFHVSSIKESKTLISHS